MCTYIANVQLSTVIKYQSKSDHKATSEADKMRRSLTRAMLEQPESSETSESDSTTPAILASDKTLSSTVYFVAQRGFANDADCWICNDSTPLTAATSIYTRGRQSPAHGPNPARKLCQSGPQRPVSCNVMTGPHCHLWSGSWPGISDTQNNQ